MGLGIWGDDDQDQLTLRSEFVRFLLNKPALTDVRLADTQRAPDALPTVTNSTVIDNAMGVLNELYEESIEPDEFGALTLHYAARASIFEIVEMIFDRYPNAVAEPDNDGWLPLHYACSAAHPDPETVKYLMAKNPAAIAHKTKTGELPIHYACDVAHRAGEGETTGHMTVVKLLLEAYPQSAYERSSHGRRPVLYIFGREVLPPGMQDTSLAPSPEKSSEEPAIVRALFQRQPYPIAALKDSAYFNKWAKIEGVKQVLSMFAGERDDTGKLPLYYVLKEKQGAIATAVAKLLMKQNPEAIREVDGDGSLPLHYACQWREPYQMVMAQELVALWPAGAAVANRQGMLPLHYAVRNGGASTPQLVSFMLEHHPEGAKTTDSQGMLPLHHACNNLSKYTVDIVNLVIAANEVGLGKSDREDMVPMHHCAKNEGQQALQLMEKLCETNRHGAMRKDRKGCLPLHYAARNQSAPAGEMTMLLLQLHPDGAEEEDREFALPLHHACLNEGPAAILIVNHLIKACTQWEGGLQKTDREGRLPLHYSCMNESELGDNITEELAERWPKGASIADRDGKLPLHYVCSNDCQMRPVAEVAKDTFEQIMDAFPGAVYHEDREERLPIHYAAMNLGPLASYLVNELAQADDDGPNKADRYSKTPLDYAKANKGIAAKEAYWKTVMTTMLMKTREYIEGDEVGEYLGIDRDEYDVYEKTGTFSIDAKNASSHFSMKTHSRGDNLKA